MKRWLRLFCLGKKPTELLQSSFLNSGNIGAADTQLLCDFPLSFFLHAKEPISVADHLIFLF